MFKGFFGLFVLATIVYIIGLNITVMDVDSAQYASISREMAETNEYLQVKHRGHDYLDKPPLLFWVSSFFFEVFGLHNWAFKIGSFLFTLLGVFSTYRLGKLLYNKEVGGIAALILYSCQAFFLFNNDVRTDTILTATVIFAIWQWMEWLKSRDWKWLIGLSLGVALAMLSKGPIGLMVPVLAVGGYILGKRSWSDIFRWEYLIMLALVALFISPMLYGLYQQFDAQPEKITRMVTPEGLKPEKGVSGVKFYLWTQSFGRISGENVWKDGSGPFFFVHNFLWSFLPWSLLFLLAFYKRLKDVVHAFRKKLEQPEWLTLIGFLLPFLVLSTSSYKLPHYIFPLYPLAAIMIGAWWNEIKLGAASKSMRISSLVVQIIITLASISLITIIYTLFFPGANWFLLVACGILFLLCLIWLPRFSQNNGLIKSGIILSIAVNLTMNAWFYPSLMKYQAGNQIVELVENTKLPEDELFLYKYNTFSFNYYYPLKTNLLSDGSLLDRDRNQLQSYLITPEENLFDLDEDYKFQKLDSLNYHPVTRLTLPFLMESTRSEELNKIYLLQIEEHK